MKNKIAIIANGYVRNLDFHRSLLKDADIIICADGGADNAKKIGVIPNYIIGDLDSVSKSSIEFFNNKSKIIKDNNQDKTDLEHALFLAETFNPSEILIMGAIGDRIDHTLANIMCLDKIKTDIKAEIIDNKNSIQLVKNRIEIKGKKDDIISVVPITDVDNLSYTGLKWNVKNLDTDIGWFGISNKVTDGKAVIDFSKGKILIIRVRE